MYRKLQINFNFDLTVQSTWVYNGRLAVERQDIEAEVERHFRDFLQLIPTEFEGCLVEELELLLSFRCSDLDAQKLTRVVLGEEVEQVLFSMPNDKSPGPDGYTVEFYKSTWGVLYKVISKIIANRLKLLLPQFISGNQSAFVKDRPLIENVLLATELVKYYHKGSVSGRCAINIDISKAFDSVQWSFLSKVLMAMWFPPTFVHWIMLCVTTVSFSVQVNGGLVGFFRSSRGLRQGCSLSPYLFVICMEVLSKMLDRAAGMQSFGYHPRCKNLGLTHLSFADDLMVLSDGKARSVAGIVVVFDAFAKISGLKISMEKSTLFLAGVSLSNAEIIASRFPFTLSQLPVRYLGLPLVTRKLSNSDLTPLLEQLRVRISSWTVRSLSFAGRLNLISSVLWSTCNFWMAAYRLPASCIDEINSICSAFLWSGTELNSRKAKLSWNAVCKPKPEGGLGLRSLKEANTVGCLKLVWRIACRGNSLWVCWVYMNLMKDQSFWSIKASSSLGSWIWRKLLKYRDLARPLCRVEVGNGESTSFWYDNCTSMGILFDYGGDKGMMDMGIPKQSTLAEDWCTRRRRRHRVNHLNDMEAIMHTQWLQRRDTFDTLLWRGKGDSFRSAFSTRDTWNHIRTKATTVAWNKGVWFTHVVPKYSFCVWLAAHDRVSTGEHMIQWNGQAAGSCVLCHHALETRTHLFFSCSYATEVWASLEKGIFRTQYSTDWVALLDSISSDQHSGVEIFLRRNLFQIVVYTIWREWNGRRYGEAAHIAPQLIGWVDKQIKDQLTAIGKMGERRYDEAYQLWVQSRQ